MEGNEKKESGQCGDVRMSEKGASLKRPMRKKMGLLPKLVAAIAIGIVVGLVCQRAHTPVVIGIGATYNGIFNQFLGFCIPLIMIGFVVPGIADLGVKAGRILALTVAIAYVSTVIAGTFAFAVNSFAFPMFLKTGSIITNTAQNAEETLVKGYFTVEIPTLMGVMTALVTSFIMGIGIAITQSTVLKTCFMEFQKIVIKVVTRVIIPLLPFHIYGIFANFTYVGTVATIMSVFAAVFALIILMHFAILIFQYTVSGAVNKRNPFGLIRQMFPAYMAAVGTQSSAATIPVTLGCTKKNGCLQKVADFVVPLCATIHLPGSTITITSCAMAVMMLNGWEVALSNFVPFILMLGVTMVAAPGVPGGAVMAALGILGSMLGFTQNMLTLMIALYVAQDSFGTACNVTGDGALALFVHALANKQES